MLFVDDNIIYFNSPKKRNHGFSRIILKAWITRIKKGTTDEHGYPRIKRENTDYSDYFERIDSTY